MMAVALTDPESEEGGWLMKALPGCFLGTESEFGKHPIPLSVLIAEQTKEDGEPPEYGIESSVLNTYSIPHLTFLWWEARKGPTLWATEETGVYLPPEIVDQCEVGKIVEFKGSTYAVVHCSKELMPFDGWIMLAPAECVAVDL